MRHRPKREAPGKMRSLSPVQAQSDGSLPYRVRTWAYSIKQGPQHLMIENLHQLTLSQRAVEDPQNRHYRDVVTKASEFEQDRRRAPKDPQLVLASTAAECQSHSVINKYRITMITSALPLAAAR